LFKAIPNEAKIIKNLPKESSMPIALEPIGIAHTDADRLPRHWSVSDVKGTLVIDEKYQEGLGNIEKGQEIVVIFHFHKSPDFKPEFLVQKPPHKDERLGVFSICSPKRPNPLGLSVLEVLRVEKNVLHVRGVDMMDGTPILDIKPFVKTNTADPASGRDNED
jgi:tRNA-Thr(GGU) m(6)t(6)A37 methyltransferase TsaA